MAHLGKARVFGEDNNYAQALRYAELALTKLKLLKDRPLDALDAALACTTVSLGFMGRHSEAMENAQERYTLWAMTDIRNPSSIWAAFDLIQCCLQIGEFTDAELYALTALEIINERTDNIIPLDQQQHTLARGSALLAQATQALAQAGGIAPEAKQEAGVKSIALARNALEINTQLFGTEHDDVAHSMDLLASVLQSFNDIDDDEVLRLYEQAIAIYVTLYGSSHMTVGSCEDNLGLAYSNRAKRAYNAHDLDRELTNLQLALTHNREAARIYTDINQAESAANALRDVAFVEEKIRHVRTRIAAEAAGAAPVGASRR